MTSEDTHSRSAQMRRAVPLLFAFAFVLLASLWSCLGEWNQGASDARGKAFPSLPILLNEVQPVGIERRLKSSHPGQPREVLLLARAEVTVDAYRHCVEIGVCSTPGSPTTVQSKPGLVSACNWGRPERGNHPMNCVSATEAQKYCSHIGLDLPTANHYRLALASAAVPAARAATANLCTRKCSSSDAASTGCTESPCDAEDGHAQTGPVGSYFLGDSDDGIYDLFGNVAEWTKTEFSPQQRVVFGTSWDDDVDMANESIERFLPPETRRADVGFRCAVMGTQSPVQVQVQKNDKNNEADVQSPPKVKPITVRDYALCVSANGCPVSQDGHPDCPSQQPGLGASPATCLSETEANTYCTWIDDELRANRRTPAPQAAKQHSLPYLVCGN